jgi:TsgA-like MFS transporter
MKPSTTENEALIRHCDSAFFFSGFCYTSSGIIVSMLQENIGFPYAVTGTLISLISVGGLIASILCGILPSLVGLKKTTLLLSIGYTLGYLLSALTGNVFLLGVAFFIIGAAKGCTLNTCNLNVGSHAKDKQRSLQAMHSCYAAGALLCPFLIEWVRKGSDRASILSVALVGLALWLMFFTAPLEGKTGKKKKESGGSRAFLKSLSFWLLAALLFCQNAAEISVTGWLVTYYKEQHILQGSLASYTVTILWAATLIGRLLMAFVIPVGNRWRTLTLMGIACTVLYFVLMGMTEPVPACIALFFYALAMAAVNPIIISCAGKAMTPEGMGILLPIGTFGAIVMPAIIGAVAADSGLGAGMRCNLISCAGITLFSILLWIRDRKESRNAAEGEA